MRKTQAERNLLVRSNDKRAIFRMLGNKFRPLMKWRQGASEDAVSNQYLLY